MTAAPRSSSSFTVASEARRRVSSPTAPPFSGTLKSTRTSTRFPATTRSRTLRFRIATSGLPQTARAEERDQVGDPAAVAPLVVVPGHHLDHVTADRHRQRTVDDRRGRVALEVARHQRLLREGEDALEGTLGRLAQRRVDLVGRGAL